MTLLKTKPICNTQIVKGILFPEEVGYRALLVTGPPGSGKSTFIRRLGGWSEEGYVDLSMNKWWTAQSLALRPREIHLGFPFHGVKEALAVFEKQWLQAEPALEIAYERICLPPPKKHFWSVNWRKRYAFEFIIPPAEIIYERRKNRSRTGTHYVDEGIILAQIERQVQVYQLAAQYLHEQGICVYVREDIEEYPLRILDQEA